MIAGVLNPDVVSAETLKRKEKQISSIELPSERSKYSKTYLNKDGSYTTDIALDPIHYQKDGRWLEIDNTLSEKSNLIVSEDHDFNINFSKKLSQNINLLEMEDENYKIELRPLPNELNKPMTKNAVVYELNENTISYTNIFDKTIVKYSLNNDRVKEEIILEEAPTIEDNLKYSFALTLENLTYEEQNDGIILLKDKATGETKYYIDVPVMYDSFVPKDFKKNKEVDVLPEEATSYDIKYDVKEDDGRLILDLIPSMEWLKSESRIYPVTLDPTIIKFQPKYGVSDTNIRSYFPTQTAPTETTLGVGLYKDSSQENIIRSVIQVN